MSMPLEQLNAQEQQNTGTAWTRNDIFEKNGYLVIRNLWDPEELFRPVPEIKRSSKLLWETTRSIYART